MTVSLKNILSQLPPERRQRIEKRAFELLYEEQQVPRKKTIRLEN